MASNRVVSYFRNFLGGGGNKGRECTDLVNFELMLLFLLQEIASMSTFDACEGCSYAIDTENFFVNNLPMYQTNNHTQSIYTSNIIPLF